jgi:uncharacterized protein YdeI (YjbR/CyaY-like superfamily)
MNKEASELLFSSRQAFREWLEKNARESEGVWLIFRKDKTAETLTANEALEEALCFGWIDGQMKSTDETEYLKYFARRRKKSVWSDKNRKTVEALRKAGRMTELGEAAVREAMGNNTFYTPKPDPVTEEQITALAERLRSFYPAYKNFQQMPPSVKRTYTRAYLAPKTEEARQRGFEKITDRLNKNLKPMEKEV